MFIIIVRNYWKVEVESEIVNFQQFCQFYLQKSINLYLNKPFPILISVLPSNAPTLTTERTFYDSGDVLRANCSSPLSRPASTLIFYLKGTQVSWLEVKVTS